MAVSAFHAVPHSKQLASMVGCLVVELTALRYMGTVSGLDCLNARAHYDDK